MSDTTGLAAAVRGGDRTALARAITLVESTRTDHRSDAEALLAELFDATGQSIRVGVSGAPGTGKSTLIEALGLHAVERDHRVAVLAVDPSSTRTGGSILGDKTRMSELGRSDRAFIRPSPTGGTLGGVARRTREAMLCCEAAGYDVVLVETVGVGQSEVTVSDMVDMFTVVLAPGAGDELQGIKRGIVELADLLVVNKADGDLEAAAHRAAADYAAALAFVRVRSDAWTPRVLECSALERKGIDELWDAIGTFRDALTRSGGFDARRADQARAWMWSELTDTMLERLRSDPEVARRLEQAEAAVADGGLLPPVAAREVLDS
ncbi:MAG: methylmalonyl Co-A mutase-associated GTPase MeaB [Acidimicrobiia bacterium]